MRAIVTGLMPLLRHSISGFAGYLVGQGILDAAMTDTFVGVAVGGLALVLSYFDPAKKA